MSLLLTIERRERNKAQCNTMTLIFKSALSVQICMYDLYGQNRTAKVTPNVYAINPNSTQVIN